MTLYASNNGVSKKVSKLYASVNGVSKEIQKMYGSYNGVSKLVYQNTPPEYDYFEIVFDASGTANLFNKWSSDILYSLNSGSFTSLALKSTASLSVTSGATLIVKESSSNSTFRSWTLSNNPFIKSVSCHMKKMPPMNRFTTDEYGTTAGDDFFRSFNSGGSITAVPAGSFDTSSIQTVGERAFWYFNNNGKLASLPAGSFDTSNITTVGGYFCSDFNNNGQLASLPAGSFDTSNITKASFGFQFFNYNGKIPKSTTSYNAHFVNKNTSSVTAYYYGSSEETVLSGWRFYYLQQ